MKTVFLQIKYLCIRKSLLTGSHSNKFHNEYRLKDGVIQPGFHMITSSKHIFVECSGNCAAESGTNADDRVIKV